MRSRGPPILKFMKERCVCAPQYLETGAESECTTTWRSDSQAARTLVCSNRTLTSTLGTPRMCALVCRHLQRPECVALCPGRRIPPQEVCALHNLLLIITTITSLSSACRGNSSEAPMTELGPTQCWQVGSHERALYQLVRAGSTSPP